METCDETFKIQSGLLNCNSEKVLCLLKCKVCGEAPYVGKVKTKFWYRFNKYKKTQSVQERKPKNTPETFSQLLLSGWSFRS